MLAEAGLLCWFLENRVEVANPGAGLIYALSHGTIVFVQDQRICCTCFVLAGLHVTARFRDHAGRD